MGKKKDRVKANDPSVSDTDSKTLEPRGAKNSAGGHDASNRPSSNRNTSGKPKAKQKKNKLDLLKEVIDGEGDNDLEDNFSNETTNETKENDETSDSEEVTATVASLRFDCNSDSGKEEDQNEEVEEGKNE